MLGNTLTSSPLFLAVSCTRSTVVVSEPNVRAPLSRRRNPGPSVDRKLSCAWLDVWKKLSLYSSETRAVGWNSRVAPRTVVIVGAKAPGCWIGYCWYSGIVGCSAGVAGLGAGCGWLCSWVWPGCGACCCAGSVEGVLGVCANAAATPVPSRARERAITRECRAALLPRGPPSPLTSPLEQSLWDKDDVVRLQPDIRILVRRPHHLINIDPNP